MDIHAVLFDLDGVLIDTEGIYTEFWGSMDALYPTGVPGFTSVIKGNTLVNILNTYFPDPDVQADIRARLARCENEMAYVPFQGAIELLRYLRQHDIVTAVVTSSGPAKMEHLFAMIPELAENVDILITDKDVTRSKPDPQGYLIAALRLGVQPENCVVVEDSIAGLEAGRRSGSFVLGIATTNPRAKVEPMADFTLDEIGRMSPPDLFDTISSYSASAHS